MALDTWAVLAWLKRQQPAASKVRSLLESAEMRELGLCMSIVNVGDVYYLSAKERDPAYADRVLDLLRSRVTWIPAHDDLVIQAASIKAQHPISYADAFAAATSIVKQVPLVSGDADFRRLESVEAGFQLEWIGE
ncbi:MAG: type II toxin-antitoxin system VapC family toxin [Bryobacteraceae bacterium]